MKNKMILCLILLNLQMIPSMACQDNFANRWKQEIRSSFGSYNQPSSCQTYCPIYIPNTTTQVHKIEVNKSFTMPYYHPNTIDNSWRYYARPIQ